MTSFVCSESLSNWWFAAHLTDLLHHCGKLDHQSFQYVLVHVTDRRVCSTSECMTVY